MGPLGHGFWRAVQDKFGKELLLQPQLTQLLDQEDVCAEPQQTVHIGQLMIHDGVGDAQEVLPDELGHIFTDI